jgi:hypothetical protein
VEVAMLNRLRFGVVISALILAGCSKHEMPPGTGGNGTGDAGGGGGGGGAPAISSDMAVAEPDDMARPQGSDLALADLSGPSVDLAMPTKSTSFQNDVLPILKSRGCFSHHMTAAWDGVEGLSANSAIISYLTSTASSQCGADKLVQPNDPMHSYVYQKVSGQFFSPCATSDPMPLGSGPLPTAESDTIKSWISAGAPNN